jgi:hypothetical protein
MKKTIYASILVLLISTTFVFSQDKEFYKGTQIISPIIGLNSYTIPFGANFEYGITDNIGVGGTAMAWLWSGELWSNSLISITADAAYHFTKLKVDKLDLFAGAGLGVSIYSFSWKSGYGQGLSGGAGSSGVYLKSFAGARYYFTPKIAGFTRLYVDFIGDWGGVGAVIGASFRLK